MKTQIQLQIKKAKFIGMYFVLFCLFTFFFINGAFAQSAGTPSVQSSVLRPSQGFGEGLTPATTPTVTCDSVLQTSTCAGGNLVVRFTVTGGSFNFGNVFTAQLSNMGGAFTTPVNIGSIAFNLGIIPATIPANTNFGIYYVRVITNNPADTSNASPNFIVITQVAQLNHITASPHNYVCPGDSITLTANNIGTYAWSTTPVQTTQSIKVTLPGIYSVTTTDALTCQSTTSDTVSNCNGIAENILQQMVSVFPNPVNDYFNLQLKTGNPTDAVITLINPLGEVLMKTKMHLSSDNEKILAVSSISPGIYFLRIQTMDCIETKRIEIIR